MNAPAQKALVRAARVCIAEADRADRMGQYRYAENLRASARSALAQLPREPQDPMILTQRARNRNIARAWAATIVTGYGANY
jgi:hypothetical protein